LLIAAILIVVVAIAGISYVDGIAVASTTSEIPPVAEKTEMPTYDKATLVKLMAECDDHIGHAEQMKAGAYGLGYEADNYVVQLAEREIQEATEKKAEYQILLDEILAEEARWARRMSEYPAATTIWLYLKELGYNDYVCAGILGNIMNEVGGNTMKLRVNLIDHSGYYYGICQWSRKYYPGVVGRDIKGQCDFIRDTIKKEIDTYGGRYAQGMNFNKFLQLTNPRDVALCFAKSYERCASAYYSVRQSNAEKAYAYFVG
jgi:hypothetical protein